jgi:hypothetical protein
MSPEVAPSDIVDPEKEELKKKEAEMQKKTDIMAKKMEEMENQLKVGEETQQQCLQQQRYKTPDHLATKCTRHLHLTTLTRDMISIHKASFMMNTWTHIILRMIMQGMLPPNNGDDRYGLNGDGRYNRGNGNGRMNEGNIVALERIDLVMAMVIIDTGNT